MMDSHVDEVKEEFSLEQQNWSPSLDHEDKKPPQIKEEQEEAEITPINVKFEDDDEKPQFSELCTSKTENRDHEEQEPDQHLESDSKDNVLESSESFETLTMGSDGSRGRRVGSTSDDLSREDMARFDNLRLQRIAFERDLVQHLDLQQTRQVLEQCLARDPSLIFDVLSRFRPASPSTIPPSPSTIPPSWCICHRCREMPTLVERKCCNQQPHLCISTVPYMEAYILQAGVLRLARRIWNDLRALVDLADPGEDNRQFRHAAYRQFVAWQCGTLDPGHRVVIPSCCVWVIRDRFPDPHGQYRAFIPRRV